MAHITTLELLTWACVFLCIGFVNISLGNAILSLKFQTFSNFGGLTRDLQCCDGRGQVGGCTSKCDHSFDVCISSGRKESLKKQCPFGRIVTGAITDANYVQFGLTVGDQRNPLLFPIQIWPPQIFLSVDIYDVDSRTTNNKGETEDDVRDEVAHLERTTIISPNNFTKTILLRRRVELSMDVRGFCAPNYYGLQCDVYCNVEEEVGENQRYACDEKGRKLCFPGWTGQDCNENINECESSPCSHQGSCIDLVNDYRCACTHQYTGPTCQVDVDECATTVAETDPCSNGRCVNTDGSYRCVCHVGFTGRHCEADIDECNSSPCQNGGMCSENKTRPGEFYCTCPRNFTGRLCEENINECITNHPEKPKRSVCQNNGSCVDTFGSFYCVCSPFWTGEFCQNDVNECAAAAAAGISGEYAPCFRTGTGTCLNREEGFQCVCLAGWSGDLCDTDIDECVVVEHPSSSSSSNIPTDPVNRVLLPCWNGGVCENLDGSYRCDCLPGWSGEKCENDINECDDDLDADVVPRCKNGGTCVNLRSGFYCQCSSFWSGDLCEIDVDECDEQSGILYCSVNNTKRCENFPGRFNCVCHEGWTGDTCEIDIDECNEKSMVCSGGFDYDHYYNSDPYKSKPIEQETLKKKGNSKNNDNEIITSFRKSKPEDKSKKGGNRDNITKVGNSKQSVELRPLDLNGTKRSDNNNTNNFVCTNFVPGYVCSCDVGWTGRRCEHVIGLEETEVPTAFSTTNSSSSSSSSSTVLAVVLVLIAIIVIVLVGAYLFYQRARKRRRLSIDKVDYVNDGFMERNSTMPRSNGLHNGNNAASVDVPHLPLRNTEQGDRDHQNSSIINDPSSTDVKQLAPPFDNNTADNNRLETVEVHFHYEVPESITGDDNDDDDDNDDNDDNNVINLNDNHHPHFNDVILRPPKTPPTPKINDNSNNNCSRSRSQKIVTTTATISSTSTTMATPASLAASGHDEDDNNVKSREKTTTTSYRETNDVVEVDSGVKSREKTTSSRETNDVVDVDSGVFSSGEVGCSNETVSVYVSRVDLVVNDGSVLCRQSLSVQDENRYDHLPYIDAPPTAAAAAAAAQDRKNN